MVLLKERTRKPAQRQAAVRRADVADNVLGRLSKLSPEELEACLQDAERAAGLRPSGRSSSKPRR
jgi:hypothetical protein